VPIVNIKDKDSGPIVPLLRGVRDPEIEMDLKEAEDIKQR